jgi:hypothetical protein
LFHSLQIEGIYNQSGFHTDCETVVSLTNWGYLQLVAIQECTFSVVFPYNLKVFTTHSLVLKKWIRLFLPYWRHLQTLSTMFKEYYGCFILTNRRYLQHWLFASPSRISCSILTHRRHLQLKTIWVMCMCSCFSLTSWRHSQLCSKLSEVNHGRFNPTNRRYLQHCYFKNQ